MIYQIMKFKFEWKLKVDEMLTKLTIKISSYDHIQITLFKWP